MNSDDAVRTKFKQELRQQMRIVRGALPADAVKDRSAAIAHKIMQLPQYQAAKTLLSYSAISHEVDPSAIVSDAQHHQKQVALPRVVPAKAELDLKIFEKNAELEMNIYGIGEPPASATPVEPEAIDLALVPSLAVDAEGYRIGYGKGYYDRLLPKLKNAFCVALIYDFQLVSEIPRFVYDAPVHAIATDTRLLHIKAL